MRTVAGADPDHTPCYVDRAGRGGEHRRSDPVRAPVGGGDAGGEQRQRRQAEGRCRVPANEQCGEGEQHGRRGRNPADRLGRQGEVEAAAGAEENWHPQEHAAALGGPHRVELDAQAGRVPQHLGRIVSPCDRWPTGRLPPGDMLNARAFRPVARAQVVCRG